MLTVDELGVIADDLTGACDVAGCFSTKSGSVRVSLGADADSTAAGPASAGTGADSAGLSTFQVFNTQSRSLDGASARELLRRAGALLGSKRVILKKIDTYLRGPVGAEMAGLLEGLNGSGGPWTCVVAPAIPAIGRTTIGGVQYDHGIRIDARATSCAGSDIVSADVRSVIEQTGGGHCRVADAETEEDLERLMETYLGQGNVVFVGSLGLAMALVTQLPPSGRRSDPGPPARCPILVCGSRHPLSHSQIEHAKGGGVRNLGFDPALMDFRETINPHANAPILISILPSRPSGSAHSPELILDRFVAACCALMARVKPDGLGVIGGETAYYLLRSLAAQHLEVFDRQAEVIACSRVIGGVMNGHRLVCKGGSVGPEDSVHRMFALLTEGKPWQSNPS